VIGPEGSIPVGEGDGPTVAEGLGDVLVVGTGLWLSRGVGVPDESAGRQAVRGKAARVRRSAPTQTPLRASTQELEVMSQVSHG
jgi:hypothetical protein